MYCTKGNDEKEVYLIWYEGDLPCGGPNSENGNDTSGEFGPMHIMSLAVCGTSAAQGAITSPAAQGAITSPAARGAEGTQRLETLGNCGFRTTMLDLM